MEDKIILFNFATRSRPAKMLAGVLNIQRLCSSKNYVINLVIDDDDRITHTSKQYHSLMEFKNVVIQKGLSKSKVHAINRGVQSYKGKWDILVNMSDDMEFHTHGFDTIIRDLFDKKDMFLHLPDGYVNEKLPTMSMMDKKYYSRFGYVYHPDYTSLWCDNEAMDVAITLGKYKYDNTSIFKHKHPLWVGESYDKQMIHSQSFYHQDKLVYYKRKAEGFPI